MSEDIEKRCTWRAVGLNGHSEVFGSEFLYTSQDAPVEADEYVRAMERADRLLVERDAATARAEAAEAQIANDYYMRRTAELATELEQLRTELAGVLETALIRGESLGYIEIDNDYRERLRELDPDAEILQDDE